ncbi:hypothetical protein CupriaWKF_22745 [Cupriavidus sp. WKF15]|uniref:hypothetical protein n=1 Tax=Cupriavidus sp. WKF15 TaxID=3032282 RepID=UPI0023E2013C|nr:hypothetical protein [Cupriavidus sp. WKF15]WER49930.1 hypothetical protein CupriaWKF_22745 [Cupriavidus sp. WKF15]
MKTLLVLNDVLYGSERTCNVNDKAPVFWTTFGKRFNPMLSLPKAAFIESLTKEIPPQPAEMARIVGATLRCVLPETTEV